MTGRSVPVPVPLPMPVPVPVPVPLPMPVPVPVPVSVPVPVFWMSGHVWLGWPGVFFWGGDHTLFSSFFLATVWLVTFGGCAIHGGGDFWMGKVHLLNRRQAVRVSPGRVFSGA